MLLRRSYLRSFLWLPMVVVAVLFCTGLASGQSGGIVVSQNVERDPESSRHDLEAWPFAIGLTDCERNVVTRLRLTLPEKGTLEVYGGKPAVNCYDEQVRVTTNSSQCWHILTEYADNTQAYQLELPARAIAGGACDAGIDQEVTVFFVLTNGGESVAWNKWVTLVDLKAPEPPADVEAGIGERRLELAWSTPPGETVSGFRFFCAPAGTAPSSGDGNGGSAGSPATAGGAAGTKDGSNSPGPGVAGGTNSAAGGAAPVAAGAGGAVAAGGVGATGAADVVGVGNAGAQTASPGTQGGSSGNTGTAPVSANATCYSSELSAGEAPARGAWACGSVNSGTAVRGSTSSLENGREYAVAIASVDELGNVSALSAPDCETPQELTDFFEEYRAVDGRAGGGFCSLRSVGAAQPRGAGPWLAVALGAGLLACRSRRGSRRTR